MIPTPSTQSTHTIKLMVEGDELEEAWVVYEQSFEEIKLEHPCRQSLTRVEFEAFMADCEVVKLLFYEEGQIVAGSLFTTNLAKIPWISAPFYDAQYPKYIGERMYAQSFFVKPSRRAAGYLEKIAVAIRDYMREHSLKVAFCDFGGRNEIAFRLILKAIGAEALKTIGTQTYSGIVIN